MSRSSAARYWPLTLGGLLLAGASIVAIDWGLYHLVRTGTCASGGPYVSARPCPPGTALHILSLVGGIFAGLVGMGLWAGRGGRGRSSRVGLGAIMWFLLFCTLAGSAALAAFGPARDEDNQGAELAAVILGAVFIPMGAGPVVFSLIAGGWRPRGPRVADMVARGEMAPPPMARPPAPPPPQSWPPATWKPSSAPKGDPVERLERLGELRAKGLISVAEFEDQKKRILGGL